MNHFSQIAKENTLLTIENEELRKKIKTLEQKLAEYEKIVHNTPASMHIPVAMQTANHIPEVSKTACGTLIRNISPVFGSEHVTNQFPSNS